VCVAPSWLRGIRGNKSTTSVFLEVSIKSLRLASRRPEGASVKKHLQIIMITFVEDSKICVILFNVYSFILLL
jgi:hypothetical protein